MPVVRVRGSSDPQSLRSYGDGLTRIFGLALALVNAANGLLLIDEVENGIHYSVQADLWKLVLRSAKRLNIQVFATTHNWDCIEAFQSVASETEDDGILIRLAKRGESIQAFLFSGKELKIVAREHIEVR